MKPELVLRYWRGLLHAEGDRECLDELFTFDERTQKYAAPAHQYRDIVESLVQRNIAYEDQARTYTKLDCPLSTPLKLRPQQKQGLVAWQKNLCRGVVSLPTGGGKTVLAIQAMAMTLRPTLVVVPTLDLVKQWIDQIHRWLGVECGQVGGGYKDIAPVTVSTYDSAVIHAETFGPKFGFLIVDECHHLPAPQFQLLARASIAPYRLGLSATVERIDGKEAIIFELLGDLVYRANIQSMVGGALSPYTVKQVVVPLTSEERSEYNESRQQYLSFLRRYRINLGSPHGWQEFLGKAARLAGGQEALGAYRRQREIAQKASGKTAAVWQILMRHAGERVIIFTDDNNHAYDIGVRLVAPVLTHHTKPAERERMLQAFRTGEIKLIVTSKVLNEGVDVPEASVAVIASGSGAVRENVQRLGRVLRGRPGKQAVMYEILADNTSEIDVSKRRKAHDAYQSDAAISP